VTHWIHSLDNKKEKKNLRSLQLSSVIYPKYTPKRIKLANPKTLQPGQKGRAAGYWVERYREKWVTTVTQMGSCVSHFRVSQAESLNFRHSNA
jgi:hypothetical protein